jgi:hypothetical protein
MVLHRQFGPLGFLFLLEQEGLPAARPEGTRRQGLGRRCGKLFREAQHGRRFKIGCSDTTAT